MRRDEDHFAFPLPHNKELEELNLKPYRTNKELKDKISYIFSHPYNPHRQLFSDVSSSGSRTLLNSMSTVAVACTRYFLDNQQQFGKSFDNIYMQILVRMWKQTFYHCRLQSIELDKYYATKMKLLLIENGLPELLLETCRDKNYIQHYDDMVKRRVGVGLRDRVGMSEKNIRYYEKLAYD